MKKTLLGMLYGVIFAAILIIFFPAGEVVFPLHMPISDLQELCITWNIPGRAAPAEYDDYLVYTDHFFSIKFFQYPGDEALFLHYIGIRSYDYNAGAYSRSWRRFICEFWPFYDAFGFDIEVLF